MIARSALKSRVTGVRNYLFLHRYHCYPCRYVCDVRTQKCYEVLTVRVKV